MTPRNVSQVGKYKLFYIMMPLFRTMIFVIIFFIVLLDIVYENHTVNSILVTAHNGFRFPPNIAPDLVRDKKHYFYMRYRHSKSLPRCADLHPRPSSRYALLVEFIGNRQGYFLSALKLSVRLHWHLHAVRNQTDLILELVRDTSPLVTDIVVMSALQAGYDQVCHSRPIDGGLYNRFVVFNMTQYESVLYLDSDILPVNDVSDLITNGTLALQRADKHVMWAHERKCNWFNAGVMLILPDPRLFNQLMGLLQAQLDSGLIRLIDTYSGISGKLNAWLPDKNQKDQAILNHIFHLQKGNSLRMSEKYNVLLYEHTDTSEQVLQYAHLIHLIHTKPWLEPWCNLKYNHGKICDMWFATPTVVLPET
jgi:hypothetical protein